MRLSNCILRPSGVFADEVENLLALFCSAFAFGLPLGCESIAARDKFHVSWRGTSALADLARIVEVVLDLFSFGYRHTVRIAVTNWSSSGAFLHGERDERLTR